MEPRLHSTLRLQGLMLRHRNSVAYHPAAEVNTSYPGVCLTLRVWRLCTCRGRRLREVRSPLEVVKLCDDRRNARGCDLSVCLFTSALHVSGFVLTHPQRQW
jgi:hypothetical protein